MSRPGSREWTGAETTAEMSLGTVLVECGGCRSLREGGPLGMAEEVVSGSYQARRSLAQAGGGGWRWEEAVKSLAQQPWL